jgi:HD-GYP domain-containing protein (c-di-GMP phosphodiesterase class II)
MGTFLLEGSRVFDDAKTKREVINVLKELNRQVTEWKKLAAGTGQARQTSSMVDKRYQKMFETAKTMAIILEAREPYKSGHLFRVADLARQISFEMEMSPDRSDGIFMAGLIHDFGMVFVSKKLLGRKRRLSDAELQIMRGHVQVGYEILKNVSFPWPVARMILEHHERINGSGYPNGLLGCHTLLESRILAVADVVDAITSARPYRPAREISVALYDIKGNRNILYDSDVVDACLTIFHQKNYRIPDD